MTDLDQCIQKVISGDSEAFRYIIKSYKDEAYTLALSVVKEEFAAKDVVQNAFIKAYTRLDSFKGDAAFKTWFYRILLNEAFQINRKDKSRRETDASITEAELCSGKSSPLSKMTEDHQRYYIHTVLKKLLPKYSLALRLFYLEEFSIEEITDITGWSNSNTKVILHRARNKMKEILTETFNINEEKLY